MESQTPTPNGQNQFPTAVRAFGRGLLRLLVILLATAILVGLVYFVFVVLYQQSILPNQENAARISVLETRQAKDTNSLNERLDDFQLRLTGLENQLAANRDTLDELSAGQVQIQEQLDEQLSQLQDLEDLQTELTEMQTEINQLDFQNQELQSALFGESSPYIRLAEEIQILKAVSLLNRSRLYLLQRNFGLAQDEVLLAREILIQLRKEIQPPARKMMLTSWIERIDLALENLPDNPVPAADDLEMVWQQMIKGVPARPYVTPTPTAFITPTPWLTGSPMPLPTFTPGPGTLLPPITATPTPYNPPTP